MHTTYSVTKRGLTPNPNTYTQFGTRENHIRYLYTSVYVGESCYGPIHSSIHGRIMSVAYTRLYTWENHVVDLYTLLYKGESYAVPVHVSIHGRIMLLTYTLFYTREDHVRYIYTSRYMGGSMNHVTDVYKLLYTGESYQVHIHLSIHGRITLWTCIQFCTPENHVRCL